MKQKFIEAYMDVAERFAQLSSAQRLHVGAIVVKDDRIISIGYNGMPAGWENDCENSESTYDERDTYHSNDWHFDSETKKYHRLKTKPEVLHAESNAIAKLARSSESGEGASLFVTHQPCMECAKLIYQSGIREVYYAHSYRKSDGVDFLQKSNIIVKKV